MINQFLTFDADLLWPKDMEVTGDHSMSKDMETLRNPNYVWPFLTLWEGQEKELGLHCTLIHLTPISSTTQPNLQMNKCYS